MRPNGNSVGYLLLILLPAVLVYQTAITNVLVHARSIWQLTAGCHGVSQTTAPDFDVFSLLQLPGALSQSKAQRRTGAHGDTLQQRNSNERVSWRIKFPAGYADSDLQTFCFASVMAPAACIFQGHPSQSGAPVVGVVATAEELSHALQNYPGAEVHEFENTQGLNGVDAASMIESTLEETQQELAHMGMGRESPESELFEQESTEEQRIASLESLITSNVNIAANSVHAAEGRRNESTAKEPSIVNVANVSGAGHPTMASTAEESSSAGSAPTSWQLILASWGPAGGIVLILTQVLSVMASVLGGVVSFVTAIIGGIFGFLLEGPYLLIALVYVLLTFGVYKVGGVRATLPVLAFAFCAGVAVIVCILMGHDPVEAITEVGTPEDKAFAGTVMFWGLVGCIIGFFIGRLIFACIGGVFGVIVGLLNHVAHLWTGTVGAEGDYMGFGVYLVFIALSGHLYLTYLALSNKELPAAKPQEGHKFTYGLFEGLKCDPNASFFLMGCCFMPAQWADTSTFGPWTDRTEAPRRYWTHLLGFAVLSAMGFFSFGLGSILLLIWLVWNRQKIRRVYRLDYATPGTVFEDSFAWLCCAPCASMQEAMQVTYIEPP